MKQNYRYQWIHIDAELKAEFPKYKIVVKDDSKLMKFINFFVRFVTPTFMTRFTTVMGYTVYMPRIYIGTFAGAEVLVHERQHMRDYRRWWLLYEISYIFLLPAVATMRAFWEWRGYRETMKFHYAWFGTPTPVFREYLVKEFISANYLWMFPFKGYMNRLVDKAALQIVDEVEGPPGYDQGS